MSSDAFWNEGAFDVFRWATASKVQSRFSSSVSSESLTGFWACFSPLLMPQYFPLKSFILIYIFLPQKNFKSTKISKKKVDTI